MFVRRWAARAAVSIGVFLIAASTHAQSTPAPDSLADLLFRLQSTANTIAGIDTGPTGPGSVSLLVRLAALEASTSPLGTSTGGFTFSFDRQLGIWKRSTHTFGPSFAERSLTNGKHKLTAGFNWLHASYDTGAGMDLKNGELRPVRNAGPMHSYSSFTQDLSSDTFVAFFEFGLTDDFDIGIAIPSIRTSMETELQIFLSSEPDATVISLRLPRTTSAGLGDIAIRGKYRFWRHDECGLAALVELHLPTGDEDNLRGLGLTRTLASAIWSRGGRISPHANVGYEFWSAKSVLSSAGPLSSGEVFVKNQVTYTAGLEFDINPRTTAVVDLVGRRLQKGGRAGYRTFTEVFGPGGSLEALVPLPEALDVVSLAPGFKWNAWKRMLVTGSVLVSLENDGLRARVVPVVGLDWAF